MRKNKHTAEKPSKQQKQMDNVSSSTAGGNNQRSKLLRKESHATKESESKKREDLTSLGSDDSGVFEVFFPLKSENILWILF